jgi:DNA repair protein RadC
MAMRIRDWPSLERPREKLAAHGARVLSDAELLAIFIGSGLRGQDAVTTARHLLNTQGSLRALLDHPLPLMERLKGIGRARACLLLAALELGHRHYATTLEPGDLMSGPGVVGEFFHRRLRDHRAEVFAVMFLDTRLRMIAFEELFHGTVDQADIYPREIAKRALALNAAAVVVGHNHPSGTPEPSNDDRKTTLEMRNSLRLLGIRLLDHVIVGEGPPLSMAARGLFSCVP